MENIHIGITIISTIILIFTLYRLGIVEVEYNNEIQKIKKETDKTIRRNRMTRLNIERVRLYKWDAYIFHDKEEGCYTISLISKGGAVVCNKNKDKAIKTWIKAMKLSRSIEKLLIYKEALSKWNK